MNIPDHVKPLETKNVTVVQANGKDITLADTRFETFIFSTPCRHGAPTDEMEVVCRLPLIDGHDEARSRAIRLVDRAHEGDATNRADYKMEYGPAIHHAEIAFWSDPRHSSYIDDAMVKLIYAMAVETLLTGNDIKVVRRWNVLATKFRERLKGSADNSNDSFLQEIYKARTDGGLKIVLNKNIPCSCLAEERAAAKAAPRTDMCYYCRKQDTEVKLLVCSRCKLAAYCSPDCQRKDWKEHKQAFCSPNAREFMVNSKK